MAVTAGPSGLGRRKRAARRKLPWDDKSQKDDDIDSEEEEEMKEMSEEEEEEACQAEGGDEPEPTDEEETSGKVGIPVHEGMDVVVGLEGEERNGTEWNIEFWPKAKHWDPLGHSFSALEGKKANSDDSYVGKVIGKQESGEVPVKWYGRDCSVAGGSQYPFKEPQNPRHNVNRDVQ